MKEALEFHFKGMLLDNEKIPEPTTQCCYVEVNVTKLDKEARKSRSATQR